MILAKDGKRVVIKDVKYIHALQAQGWLDVTPKKRTGIPDGTILECCLCGTSHRSGIDLHMCGSGANLVRAS